MGNVVVLPLRNTVNRAILSFFTTRSTGNVISRIKGASGTYGAHNFGSLISFSIAFISTLQLFERKMPPKHADDLDDVSVGDGRDNKKSVSNNDLVPDAGKVHLDPAQPWGKGIIADFKRTVGTHWVEEMTNFNQKTVAVSLLMFITVSK